MSPIAAKTVAQAKINLFLRILGKGVDGYHSIETLFLRLDVGDDVTLRVTDLGRAVDCEGLTGVPAEQNLAYRAAETYAAAPVEDKNAEGEKTEGTARGGVPSVRRCLTLQPLCARADFTASMSGGIISKTSRTMP